MDSLLKGRSRVIGVDNLLTGRKENLREALRSKRFTFRKTDISRPLRVPGRLDRIYHLASPASPIDYFRYPLETLRAGSLGTWNALELAREKKARFLLASTSEVYGDPEVVPQPETYWGRVNPVGVRSVYDEAKRFSEALASAYHREGLVVVRIARIFNTYGPRMNPTDGRAIPNFLVQAIRGEPLTIHGNGEQTRSFCYVEDMVDGLKRLMESEVEGPLNLGNPVETRVRDLAESIAELAGSASKLKFETGREDDPFRRNPDVRRAKSKLGWAPRIGLEEGLKKTLADFRRRVQ